MRSSSRLFPVSLMAAELTGKFSEDIYQLNPGTSKDSSVRLTVTRITDPDWRQSRRPVILLHGEFRNRRDFISPDGRGLAAQLAESGFDVWIPEMRGHGLTPPNDRMAANRLLYYAREDWPQVHRFVMEQVGGQPPIWVAPSLGAQSLACGLIHVPKMLHDTAGVVFVDPGSEQKLWLWQDLKTVERWRVMRKNFIDGLPRQWGPEREPVMLLREQRHWQMAARQGQHPVFDHLRRINVPSLTIAHRNAEEVARRFHGKLGGREKAFLALPDRSSRSENPGDAAAWPPDIRHAIEHWLIEGNVEEVKVSPEQLTG
ncbi:alpha/beta fold hydrolase [Marinobacteraceae bacterium S3BR75-40.1]